MTAVTIIGVSVFNLIGKDMD